MNKRDKRVGLDTAEFIRELLYFPVGVVLENLKGWFAVLVDLVMEIRLVLHHISPAQALFLMGNLLLVVDSLMPWITYHVDFLGPEQVRVGSNFKTLFVLQGFAGLFLGLVDFPARSRIYLISGAGILLFYGAGFLWPNPIHTTIKVQSEYSFLVPIYLYGPILLLNLGTAFSGTRNPRVRVFKYLLPGSSEKEKRSLPREMNEKIHPAPGSVPREAIKEKARD